MIQISASMGEKIRESLREFGLPRLIIAGFLVVLFIAAPFVGVSMPATLKDICNRFGQNELLTLAMCLSGAVDYLLHQRPETRLRTEAMPLAASLIPGTARARVRVSRSTSHMRVP